jgi:threonine dehydratase
MFADVAPVTIAQINDARLRLDGTALNTPVVGCDAAPDGREVWLKLENLQPIGSFKVRPIGNAVLSRPPAELSPGLYTSSSGNSALGVAWMARRLSLKATAIVPDNAPEAKLAGLRRLGAEILVLPYADWWRVIETGRHAGLDGLYVDAVRDPASLAGDGTIGVEIAVQLPELDAVFVPFGGGGLASGIACAIRALSPTTRIVACELETAQPMRAAMMAGRPVDVPAEPGFVCGVGYGSVLPEMWPLVSAMIDEVVVVTLDQVREAIRIMIERNHVVAEGAGAVAVAAALFGDHRHNRVCSVVSGGNIDPATLGPILMSGRDGQTR